MSGPVSRETLLKPDEIEVRDRLRPVVEAGVQTLIASIGKSGILQNPIQVRKQKDGRYRLIAGLHRLEAARRLNWEMIPCRAWSGTGVTDEFCLDMEIDDNLAGAELDPLDSAIFMASKHRLYLRQNPDKRQGLSGAKARWGDATETVAFASAMAGKFGISERHVWNLIAAGEAVLGAEARRLQACPARPGMRDLMALSKAAPALRTAAIDRFCSGEVSRLADALRKPVEPADKDPVEDALNELMRAWDRAPEVAKKRFVAAHHAALSARVHDEAERRIASSRPPEDNQTADIVRASFGPHAGKAAS